MKFAITVLRLIGWLILLWAALIIITSSGKAQSPKRVLKQAARALGGEKELRKVKSTLSRGVITRASDGLSGNVQILTALPNSYSMRIELGGLEVSVGYNGKSGWRRDSRDGARTLTGGEGLDFQAEAVYRNNRWLNSGKERAKIVSADAAEVNGRPCNALFFTTSRGVMLKLYFDAASWLTLREEFPAGESSRAIEYGDFRAVGAVMEPFALVLIEGGDRFEIKLDEVKHNVAVDPATFDFPKYPRSHCLIWVIWSNRFRTISERSRNWRRNTPGPRR